MSQGTLPDLKGVPPRLGRYELRYRLASGGMASVWLARATGGLGFEKVVAIKTIHEHLTGNEAVVRMFIDEARIASGLNHPNVCQVFDFGNEGGTYYLVMEYLVGEPLSRVIRRLAAPQDGRLREQHLAIAARIIADVAEGLHAAHELKDEHGTSREVVHRDVSPQNIFVTYDGAVKVVDFGVARARARLEQTRVGEVKGKMGYMAPEQLAGGALDRRADVWALGVCLWELLTLQRLFRRDDPGAAMVAITVEPIARPSSVLAVPRELDAIVMRSLSRDLGQRYPTARELGRDLRAWLAKSGHVVEPPEVGEWMQRLFPQDHHKRVAAGEAALEGGAGTTPASLPSALVVSEPDSEAPEPTAVPARDGAKRWLPVALVSATLVLVVVATVLGLQVHRLGTDEPLAEAARSPPAVSAPPLVSAEPPAAAAAHTPDAGASMVATAPELAGLVAPAGQAVLQRPSDAGTAEQGSATTAEAGGQIAIDAGPVAGGDGRTAAAAPAAAPDAGSPAPRPRAPRPPRPEPGAQGNRVAPATAPAGNTGTVRIKGAPGEYEVFVDGNRAGVTPLRLEVPVGAHRLEFRAPGIPGGQVQTLTVTLASEYVIELK